jgi:hypothetical protein
MVCVISRDVEGQSEEKLENRVRALPLGVDKGQATPRIGRRPMAADAT